MFAIGLFERVEDLDIPVAVNDEDLLRYRRQAKNAYLRQTAHIMVKSICSTGLCTQFQSEGLQNFQDRIEPRASFTRESFVEAFARQTRITGDLSHAFGACNIPKGFGNKSRITVGLFQASFQVGCHFLRCTKMLGNIVFCGGRFSRKAPL
jgi:hypothetical protein